MKTYHTLDLRLNGIISFSQASLAASYRHAGFSDLEKANGPYTGYKVVDLPDSDQFSSMSRIGVRRDGMQGACPLYYVRCQDVLTLDDKAPFERGDIVRYIPRLANALNCFKFLRVLECCNIPEETPERTIEPCWQVMAIWLKSVAGVLVDDGLEYDIPAWMLVKIESE